MLALDERMSKRTKTKRHEVRREDRADPTPETAAKLLPDSLAHLAPEYQRAAGEIERAYRLCVGKLMAKAADPESLGRGKHEMTDEQAALVSRYRDWAAELERRRIPIHPLLNIIVDAVPAWTVDQGRGWQAGTAAERLMEGLMLWCRPARK